MVTVPKHVPSFIYGVFLARVLMPTVRVLKTLGEDTLAERYERTMTRIEQITKAGYTVTVMWECEFDTSKIVERKPQLLTHPLVSHSPLYTRVTAGPQQWRFIICIIMGFYKLENVS